MTDSAHLTPAERERLRADVLDERHPLITVVEHEILAEPSPPPTSETPELKAERRRRLLADLWTPHGYTRWRAGSYSEDDLTRARRRRDLNAALQTERGAVALPGNRATTISTPSDASSDQRTTDDRQKGAA